jgi:ABC-type branched-subunit amino acid transport system substrate-binding protein
LRGHAVRLTSAVLAVLALLASGCGSRLSDEDRAAVIAALTARGGNGEVTTEGNLPGTAVDTADGGDGGGDNTGGGTGSDTPGSDGGPAGPSGDGEAAAGCSGTGGATDTGVSAKKVTVATLADISGIQPGLFQSAHQAARAAAAYINSAGGICGRQVEPFLLDSKTDSGGNRAAMLEACEKAFAVVGSMSAFDDGSAQPGQACGIPDMSAITTNAPKSNTTNTYPINPASSGYIATTAGRYIAKTYPDVVKKAGVIWLNQAVTKNNAAERVKAWTTEGFDFKYQAEAQVLEANYTRFVQQMRSQGIQFVTMVSDFQSVVRLQKAMRQQNYVPKVRGFDSVAYDGDYLSEKAAVEGSYVFINTAMFEEASSNPEMKLYTEWLQRVSPGAVPDYFGVYAWSAYRLFQKLATEIGPNLKRPALLAKLRATKEWNANGLHVGQRIGEKRSGVCNLWLQVKGGRFQRLNPSKGFNCDGAIVKSR